jgi:hypothetical protein
MNRRDFLKLTAVGAGTTLGGAGSLPAETTGAPAPGPRPPALVGMATGAEPLSRPDLGQLLDQIQSQSGANALFPFIYSHIPDRAGIDPPNFRGGNYAIPHMQYYQDTILTYADMRGPEFGDKDLLALGIAAARPRGIKTFAWIIEDNRRPKIPNWAKLYEIDFHGRRSDRHPGGPCNNNPYYRGYLLGLVEDYTRSYEIDGIMWGSERQGGLHNALGAFHNGGGTDPGRSTCFCEFCQKKGRDLGIDVERARAGFGEIEKYVRAGRAHQRPRDGYYVTFWRILLRYPELLAWENLWVRSRHELQAELYRKVKSINPALPVGWHIWHNISFSPFHRAEEDYAEMTAFSDFIRPVLYSNCAGERMRSFTDSVHGNVLGDGPPDEMLQVLYHQLNYTQEAPYRRVAATGLSADYVQRETRRAVDGVAGTATQVWPGIDIDVPVAAGSSHCTPESVRATVRAVFQGGGQGILLSRNFLEMKPENVAAAGAALRELGVL